MLIMNGKLSQRQIGSTQAIRLLQDLRFGFLELIAGYKKGRPDDSIICGRVPNQLDRKTVTRTGV